MALPQQLKTARAANATPGNTIDNVIGEFEQAAADILGVAVNTNIPEVVTSRAKYVQVTDSNTLTTWTTTAFNKTYAIPANSLAVGNVIRVRAFGKFSIGGSDNQNAMELAIRIGGSIIYFDWAIIETTVTDSFWYIEAMAVVRAIGSSGTLMFAGGRSHWGTYPLVNVFLHADLGTSGLSATVNTTGSLVVDVTDKSGGILQHSATMQGLVVEVLPAGSTS